MYVRIYIYSGHKLKLLQSNISIAVKLGLKSRFFLPSPPEIFLQTFSTAFIIYIHIHVYIYLHTINIYICLDLCGCRP